MNVKEFLEALKEGKGAEPKYVVVVNGERICKVDSEEEAWDIAIGYQNDDSGYYGQFPQVNVITEYDECYDLDECDESLSQEVSSIMSNLRRKYGNDIEKYMSEFIGLPDNNKEVWKNGYNILSDDDLKDYETPEQAYDRQITKAGYNIPFEKANISLKRNDGKTYAHKSPIIDYSDILYTEDGWNKFVNWVKDTKGIDYNDKKDKYDDFLEEDLITEAPDELGFETDDEIEAQERAEFEKKLAQRKQQRDDAKKKELDRQEQEKQKELARKQAKEKGKELYDKFVDSDLEDVFSLLVPANGKADTVAGEIIRAYNRLDYRYFNDGDVFYEGYGRETCGSDAAYLMETTNDEIYKILEDMVSSYDDGYSKGLSELGEEIRLYLLNNPELFGTTNEQDSRVDFDLDEYVEEPKDYEYQVWLDGYYWESPDGEEIYLRDYINNGDVDTWKVIEYFKDLYFGDNVSFKVDTPWSHQDNSISLYDMNKDSYETIKVEAEDPYLLADLIEELYNEYGDPNEEEEE